MQRGAVVRFAHAVFVPPGYSSMLYSELNGVSSCPHPSRAVSAFAPFMLRSFGLAYGAATEPTLKILFISRRPYNNTHVQHLRISRQIGNEKELIGILASHPNVKVTVVEFSGHSYRDQLALVAQHDVMVGMHGAGMTHLLWLPPWAGVFEMYPRTGMGWKCYQHMSHWSGFVYDSWENPGGYVSFG